MNPNRVLNAIVLIAAILALTSALVPQTVYADCGQPGMPPCSTGGDKKKVPTRTPLPTHTAIAIQQIVPVRTLSLGVGAASALAPTLNPEQQVMTFAAQTEMALTPSPTSTPTQTPTSGASVPVPPDRPIVTPVAGPLFLRPGTAVMIIIVTLLGLLIAGAVLLSRWLNKGGGQRPPNPNKGR